MAEPLLDRSLELFQLTKDEFTALSTSDSLTPNNWNRMDKKRWHPTERKALATIWAQIYCRFGNDDLSELFELYEVCNDTAWDFVRLYCICSFYNMLKGGTECGETILQDMALGAEADIFYKDDPIFISFNKYRKSADTLPEDLLVNGVTRDNATIMDLLEYCYRKHRN